MIIQKDPDFHRDDNKNYMTIPKLSQNLNKEQLEFLKTFSKSCRHSIIAMLKQSQSGHPGGSLGCIDYLSLLYAFILSKTGEKIVVSNGHISPAVYSVLAEMGYIPKEKVIQGFRKIGCPYEGHVTRHVPGIWYGTGPLGAGVSAASGFALAEKLKSSKEKVFALIGDGESQEGQVYEMMNFAHKYKLDNFITFMDYNQVQLTDSIEKIMPMDFKAIFKACGWKVIEVKGHDYQSMWKGLREAYTIKNQPVLLLGHTIMGKGVDFMEKTGKAHQSTWHGNAPKPEQADEALAKLKISVKEEQMLEAFRKKITWQPNKVHFEKSHTKVKLNIGKPKLYTPDVLTDCRSAYGNALLDLAKKNKNVVALTADVAGSVKTDGVKKELPNQHIECGIAEQNMVSVSGGLSLNGFIPFCSTFGAFISSRAKDQARVNDINNTNVKMVATHCGLSVGEDGPTHQAIDDSGSFLGFFNTMQIEPADPNHCDRIIRYVASHYGNCYVRMGRHKIPVLTKENGKPFFDEKYKYIYGKCDILREGKDITIAATGATVIEAFKAWGLLREKGINTEVIIISSIKQFDDTLFKSIEKTKHVLTVEDHNTLSGLGGQLARKLQEKNIQTKSYDMLGVYNYQLSGTAKDLYKAAKIDANAIVNKTIKILTDK